MDWLRSEDLKEEKNVTAPTVIIAVDEPLTLCRSRGAQGVPLPMDETYLECRGSGPVLVRMSRVTPDVLRDLLGMAHRFVIADAAPFAISKPPRACLILALKQAKADYARLQ
jgi:hypothetical protein